MSHLEILKLKTNMPRNERIIHEGLDFIHFWLKKPNLDIFEILILYKEYRTNLIIKDK